ncbi:DUF6318 family protein [Microbacterium sp. GXS0129]|uniref:DUF6318 family protein n=1 Tax=Microbacterium sp. GXS0129 TaxID=3377836 RepID=UPI00383B462C
MLVSLAALTGCTAESSTAPTRPAATPIYHPATPAPASDADVEAAVAALSNYTDASNHIDWTDASSLEAFYSLSTGNQNQADRRTYSELFEAGWRTEGAVQFSVVGISPDHRDQQVSLFVCVDVSNLRFFDASGTEQVRTSSSPVRERTAVVVHDPDGQWRVSDLVRREGSTPC